MREVIRRNWRFWVVLAEVLVLTAFFAHYIGHRQNVANQRQSLANQRNERQRAAICAILANIPGRIPPEMERARTVFARPEHPSDCQPIRRPSPTPTPEPTVTATPMPRQTVVIRPGPTVTARSTSHPSATPPKRPPSPSPTPTCITVICLGPRWSDATALRQVRSLLRR